MLPKRMLIDVQSNMFSFFEKRLRSSLTSNHYILPIWIIGAPRTGTTLIYQVLCAALNCSYITNRVAERYRIALLTRKYERKFIGAGLKPSGFSSDYGRTNTPEDPHEAGSFFYQFFPKEKPYVSVKDVSIIEERGFKQVIDEIALPHEVFVSKNTYHSLRIQVLSKLYPSSIFVWVKRDLGATMKSIYIARKKTKNENKWWGLNPPGSNEKESLPALDQIKWQVEETNEIIRRDLQLTNAKFFEINYESFCNKPVQVIEDLVKTTNLDKKFFRNQIDIPQKFNLSKLGNEEIDQKILQFLKQKND